MRPALWLLLAALPAGRTLLLDEILRVEPARWRAVDITLRQRPAVIECRFEVVGGLSGVRLVLMRREDAERFRKGRPHRAFLSTPYQKSGEFRYAAGLGEYALVLDNRLEGRRAADVRLEISLFFGGRAQPAPREVPIARRIVVILAAGLFSTAMAMTAGRRLWRAWRARNVETPASPPAVIS